MKIKSLINYLNFHRFDGILRASELKNILLLIPLMALGGFIEIGALIVLPLFLKKLLFIGGETLSTGLVEGGLNAILDTRFSAIIFVGLFFLFRAIYALYLSYKINKFGFMVQGRLETDIFYSYLGESFDVGNKNTQSDKLKNITKEVQEFVVHSLIPYLVLSTEIIILATTFSFMLIFYTEITIGVLLFMGFFGYVTHRVVNQRIVSEGLVRQKYESLRFMTIEQAFSGFREIKSNSLEGAFVSFYKETINVYTQAYTKIFFLVQAPRILLDFILVVLIFLMVFFVSSSGETVENSFITIAVFGLFSMRVLPSVNKILISLQSLDYSQSSIGILKNVLNNYIVVTQSPEEYSDLPNLININNNSFDLWIDNISYQFCDESGHLFSGISKIVSSGEIILIDGPSGSGKSTFADIVAGLVDPTIGEFKLHANANNEVQKRLFLLKKNNRIRLVAYVSQFTFVFNGTLAQNISLNFETITEVELQTIEKIVENVGLNSGHADNLTLSSILGAGGIELSGGQKRRLGIARALYKNCKVLVLDEVSTGLDTASEAEITGLITSLANRGLIIFVISHSERLRSLCTAKIALLK